MDPTAAPPRSQTCLNEGPLQKEGQFEAGGAVTDARTEPQ